MVNIRLVVNSATVMIVVKFVQVDDKHLSCSIMQRTDSGTAR